MPEQVTGVTLLRKALQARMKKHNLTALARELAVSMPMLESFAAGQVGFCDETLCALTPHLFPSAVYNPSIDRLQAAVTAPPFSLPPNPPPYQASHTTPTTGGLNIGGKPPPKPKLRAGWAE
jgi:hypothetical protein